MSSSPRPLCILIVDDNPTNLKLARLVLEADGFQVRVATDAEEALACMESNPPDLILMDLQLPGIDGLELTRRIKADPTHAQRPILALTAYAMKGDEDRARAAGCDGYLTKPIDTRSLARTVADCLPPNLS